MKDSGVELIGLIPEEWSAVRLKYLCRIQTGEEDTQDANEDGEYPFYVRSPFIERSTKYTFDGEGILVAGDGAGAGRVFHHAFGKYAVHQRVYRLSDFHCHTRFLYNYLICIFPYEMDRGSAQSTVPSIRLPMLQNFRVLIPPTKMSGIANFLDTKCAEIDKVVEKTRESIEEYKKLKQTVITEAVTKGVRGPRPMKPSGVEWIGDIPKTWEIIRIKYVTRQRNQKSTYNPSRDIYIGLENIIGLSNTLIETESQYEETEYCLCKKDDVLYSRLRPNLAKTIICPYDAFCTGELMVFSEFRGEKRFFRYWLLGLGFRDNVVRSTYGTKMPRANPTYIVNLPMCFPSTGEQQEIADYLDAKCGEIDRLISKKEQLIAELEAYKKSLIYEYVTGKKEVSA